MRNALVHRQAPRVGLDAAKVDHVIEKKKKKHKSVLQSRRTNRLLIKTRLHSAASVSSARGAKKGKKKKRPVVHKWCYFCSPQGCKYSIIKETSKKRKYHCGHVGCMSPLTTLTNRVDKWWKDCNDTGGSSGFFIYYVYLKLKPKLWS